MFDHSSTPSDLPQDDFCFAVPSLPIDKRHLEQLLKDVLKVIETGEELLATHRYERHVMENDLLEWREDSDRPMEANLGYAPDKRLPQLIKLGIERKATFMRIAQLLGKNIDGLSEEEAATSAVDAVEELRRQIGVPARIRDIGGTEDQLAVFAEKTFTMKRLRWVIPRKSTLADFEEILRQAF